MGTPTVLAKTLEQFRFEWDYTADRASLRNLLTNKSVWSGSLLPAFVLHTEGPSGTPVYVKAAATNAELLRSDDELMLSLDYGVFGDGKMHCRIEPWGLRIVELSAEWAALTDVVSLHFGTRRLTEAEMKRAPRTDQPFWPDWSADGCCVPCAESGPTKSFIRCWDMGEGLLPLGSFGPAMGTPYSAAFPRPVYAAALGGRSGWVAIGPGSIPDAAVSLRQQPTTTSMVYTYREDLWGAADRTSRTWREPLRLAWGPSAYEAYDRLYKSFGLRKDSSPVHLRSFICTWGDFKEGRFDLKSYVRRVSQSVPADMVILDDLWETFNGSGEPNLQRFPEFEQDLRMIRENGYELAFWQSVGWVDKPEAVGLTAEDLLCGEDGVPRQWNWSGNPIAAGSYHYCLDPSSERSRRFLRERTERLVKRWNPVALKLDFAYGIPGPDVCAPRNPAYRGERLAVELLDIVASAAKAVRPDITIIYYGIHPLLYDYYDLINIDDLGDAGDSAAYERTGHNQRCMWAALAAANGMPVNTSSGYYYGSLESILLDTAVVGTVGLTPGETDGESHTLDERLQSRWYALNRWRRRTCGWRPHWLEADMGGFGAEPSVTSWGRLEPNSQGAEILTALTLRNDGPHPKRYDDAACVRFTGDWALISQDDGSVADSTALVCIPFQEGTLELTREFTAVHTYHIVEGRLERTRTESKSAMPELSLNVTHHELDRIAGFVIELAKDAMSE